MKKVFTYIKVLLIIILSVGVIGGTAYLFYKSLKTKPNFFQDMNAHINSSEKSQFDANITTVESLASSSDNSNLLLIKKTNAKLNEISASLMSYYIISSSHNVDETKISNSLNGLKSAMSTSNVAIAQYKDKEHAGGFDMAIGANDVYRKLANYLLSYSNFVDCLNQEISKLKVDTDSDLKFSVIDLYINIVKDTFDAKNIVLKNNLVTVKSKENLDAIQGVDGNKLKFENSYLQTNDNFSYFSNEFINNYKVCNKIALTTTFASLLNQYGDKNLTEVSEAEQKVAVCFKNIFGN